MRRLHVALLVTAFGAAASGCASPLVFGAAAHPADVAGRGNLPTRTA